MSNELIVPVVIFLACQFGGLLKAILGTLNAINGGETFKWTKFLATVIAAFSQAAIGFGAFYAVDMTVGPSGLFLLAIMALVFAYRESVPLGKTGAATINKVTGGG